jgi:glycosyltransferase involved in cell wall biosynthesis
MHRSSPPSHALRLGILATGGPGWIAGAVYISNVIRALSRLPDEERPRIELLLGPASHLDYLQELGTELPPVFTYSHVGAWPASKRIAGTVLSVAKGRRPHRLEDVEADVVFPALASLGRAFPLPWIGWIPDLQHRRLPEYFSAADRRSRDDAYQRLAGEASHLVVSSRDACSDLMHWLSVDPDRVSVLPFRTVPEAAWFRGDPRARSREFGLPEKYLIFPSQFWAHKNHQVVFEAIRLLREMGLPDVVLICTGLRRDTRSAGYVGTLWRYVEEHCLEDQVRVLGLLPRPIQIDLVRGAAAVVQPSLFEGWSAVVEDARALGKRIYVSDIPVHHEQNPDDAAFFPADEPESLARLIADDWPTLTSGPDLREEEAALARNTELVQSFARSLVRIARLAVQR